jgi:hypothetical protein
MRLKLYMTVCAEGRPLRNPCSALWRRTSLCSSPVKGRHSPLSSTTWGTWGSCGHPPLHWPCLLSRDSTRAPPSRANDPHHPHLLTRILCWCFHHCHFERNIVKLKEAAQLYRHCHVERSCTVVSIEVALENEVLCVCVCVARVLCTEFCGLSHGSGLCFRSDVLVFEEECLNQWKENTVLNNRY